MIVRSGTIAFLLGVLFLQQFGTLPDSSWIGILVVSIPLALFIRPPFNLVGWFVSGFLWSLLFAQHILAVGLTTELEGKNLLIEGQVASLPLKHKRRIRFELDVQQASLDGEQITLPPKIRLSWYHKTPRELIPGERWRFMVRLKRPTGLMNPGGFDYEAWLFQHRIGATGYIRKSRQNQKISEAHGYPIQQGRYWIKNRLQQVAGKDKNLGLLLALVIGDKSSVSARQWQSLQSSGTNHLMSISGLHIGLLAGIAFFLGQYVWRWSRRGMLLIAAPRVGALFAITAAVSYAAMAGFAIPTQRALIMVLVTMLAIFRAQPVKATRVLAFALLLVLLVDPLAVLSASFWLSFVAVAIIFYCSSGRLVALPKWQQGIQIQLWISLGMFPLVLFWFQQVSLSAPLVNFVVVPLVGLMVVPLALIATFFAVLWPPLGTIVIQIPLGLLNVFDWLISRLDYFSWLQWSSSGGVLETGLASFGLMLLLAPRGFPGKYMGWILILPVALGSGNTIPQQTALFSLLDVGQGLSAVVQTRYHTLVYDTGARLGPRFDMGKAVVLPFLRYRGVRHIDRLIISHGDNDHRGGFQSIWQGLPVASVMTSVPELLPDTGVTKPCYQGDRWQWDGVQFEILHPGNNNRFKRNNASCVLKITAGNKSVLLTGDIEKPAERWLLNNRESQLKVDVLVAAHHGSNTSSINEFIDAVAPQIVLFPVGYRNRYRFPARTVLNRFARHNVQQYRTDSSGAISFVLGEHSDLDVQEYRVSSKRYWYRE